MEYEKANRKIYGIKPLSFVNISKYGGTQGDDGGGDTSGNYPTGKFLPRWTVQNHAGIVALA